MFYIILLNQQSCTSSGKSKYLFHVLDDVPFFFYKTQLLVRKIHCLYPGRAFNLMATRPLTKKLISWLENNIASRMLARVYYICFTFDGDGDDGAPPNF